MVAGIAVGDFLDFSGGRSLSGAIPAPSPPIVVDPHHHHDPHVQTVRSDPAPTSAVAAIAAGDFATSGGDLGCSRPNSGQPAAGHRRAPPQIDSPSPDLSIATNGGHRRAVVGIFRQTGTGGAGDPFARVVARLPVCLPAPQSAFVCPFAPVSVYPHPRPRPPVRVHQSTQPSELTRTESTRSDSADSPS